MATKAEIIAEIHQIDAEIDISNLTHSDLVKLLAEIKEVEEVEQEKIYRVSKGCSIVCRRGILSPGTVVTADDFGGSETNLLAAAKKGTVEVS
jgi:hypothetical protein